MTYSVVLDDKLQVSHGVIIKRKSVVLKPDDAETDKLRMMPTGADHCMGLLSKPSLPLAVIGLFKHASSTNQGYSCGHTNSLPVQTIHMIIASKDGSRSCLRGVHISEMTAWTLYQEACFMN